MVRRRLLILVGVRHDDDRDDDSQDEEGQEAGSKDMIRINYGNGECDRKFTLVSEKGSLEIELEN